MLQDQTTLAKNSVDKAKFIAITSDGLYAWRSDHSLLDLKCHSIPMLKAYIWLSNVPLKQKLVSFACDSAAVMVGKNNRVSALLQRNIRPSLITVHCFAHRLELSYNDSVNPYSVEIDFSRQNMTSVDVRF